MKTALKRELDRHMDKYGKPFGIEVYSLKTVGYPPTYKFYKGRIYNVLDYGNVLDDGTIDCSVGGGVVLAVPLHPKLLLERTNQAPEMSRETPGPTPGLGRNAATLEERLRDREGRLQGFVDRRHTGREPSEFGLHVDLACVAQLSDALVGEAQEPIHPLEDP